MPTRNSLLTADRGRKTKSRGTTVLRDINSQKILQLLRRHHPCSCSDLARFSGLSVPTVLSSVGRMERIGLVKRIGKGSSNGGRRPDLLAFNVSYGCVAGIEIGEGILRVGIADLAGEVLGETVSEIGEKS